MPATSPGSPVDPSIAKSENKDGSTSRSSIISSNSDIQGKYTLSSGKLYPSKTSIFRSVETTPARFTGALCPLNLLEQKERFLQFGITPKFVLKGNVDTVANITNKDKGEIRFSYLSEAIAILDAVKKKFGDGSLFMQEMYGERIDDVAASEVLAQYLNENGLSGVMDVYFAPDLACSAKMMWHGPSQKYNKPEARKYTLILKNSSENVFLRENGILCLANHEIGTHYFRMVNDGLQPWYPDRSRFQLKSMSCRESSSSEEGLATINTVLQAKSKYLWTSALLYYTACRAASMTFRELFDHLAVYITDKDQRWKHVMRVKRGLRNPNDIGGYGNDQCYFEGAVEILRNLDIIDFQLLYSGRLCIEELKRVKRLARVNCIKLPKFMKNIDKYKRNLRQIGIINGLIPKPERKIYTKRKQNGANRKLPSYQQNSRFYQSNLNVNRNSAKYSNSNDNEIENDSVLHSEGKLGSAHQKTSGLLSRPKSRSNRLSPD